MPTTFDDSAAVTLLRLADAIEDDPDVWERWSERDDPGVTQYDDGGVEVQPVFQAMARTEVVDANLIQVVFGSRWHDGEAVELLRFVADLPSGDWTMGAAIRAGFSDIERHPGRRVCLSGLDLSGIQGHGAILVGAAFSRTSFVGADLSDANCSRSNFVKANFTRASLPGIRFCLTHLGKASFVGADVSRARMAGSDCIETDFTEASLKASYCARVTFTQASLVGADCTDTDFSGADFDLARMEQACLVRTVFTGAHLGRADLTGAIRLRSDPPIPGWEVAPGAGQAAPDGWVITADGWMVPSHKPSRSSEPWETAGRLTRTSTHNKET